MQRGSCTVNTKSCWRCLPPILRAAVPFTASAPLGFFPVTMSRNRFSASWTHTGRCQLAGHPCHWQATYVIGSQACNVSTLAAHCEDPRCL